MKCTFRYVTDKTRENFELLGMEGEPEICTICLGELTGKVINSIGYLVSPEELELEKRTRASSIPRTSLVGCRPCMKKRGMI